MRIIVLILALGITMYLVMRQVEEVTPTEGEGAGVIYGKELEKARGVEQLLQEQADKSLEQADELVR